MAAISAATHGAVHDSKRGNRLPKKKRTMKHKELALSNSMYRRIEVAGKCPAEQVAINGYSIAVTDAVNGNIYR